MISYYMYRFSWSISLMKNHTCSQGKLLYIPLKLGTSRMPSTTSTSCHGRRGEPKSAIWGGTIPMTLPPSPKKTAAGRPAAVNLYYSRLLHPPRFASMFWWRRRRRRHICAWKGYHLVSSRRPFQVNGRLHIVRPLEKTSLGTSWDDGEFPSIKPVGLS